MTYQAIIVGGGASGLALAVSLLRGKNSLTAKDILIIERCDRVGKKLISTGNGQGNLLNQNLTSANYHGGKDFINQLFPEFSTNLIQDFLNGVGIYLTTDGAGKMYPVSRQASAVLDIFRSHLLNAGVEIICSSKVEDIDKQDGVYKISANGNKFYSKNVILAFGGSAGKQFGTDGTSYHLAQKFGHKLTKTYPSLVQLKTQTQNIKGLRGIKETATVSAYLGNQLLGSQTGDVLFTEYGVSGDAIFRLSSCVSGVENARLKIEFLPDYTLLEVEQMLDALSKTSPLYAQNAFVGILNKKVGEKICLLANSRSPKILARACKNFELKITGSLGFDYAQTTRGGIETKYIDAQSFESKLCKNLYILGEALDVDGDCGGYNLAFAFYSAIKSASAIKLQIKGE